VVTGGRGGWVVGGTMNPSPSTDRQYRDFIRVNFIKPVLIQPVLGTQGAGTRYRVPGGQLFSTGTKNHIFMCLPPACFETGVGFVSGFEEG
jgi:hypothetical protein